VPYASGPGAEHQAMTDRRPGTSAFALAGFLLVAGVAHFVIPRSYQRIVPRVLGNPAFWVRWSGVAEIACAALVAHPRTRRPAALAAIALFVVVFPANVQMALDGGLPGSSSPVGSAAVAWARLPLQVPLIWWAWRVARSASGTGLPGRRTVSGTGLPGRKDVSGTGLPGRS
jgi:uncharacterized membrane protein